MATSLAPLHTSQYSHLPPADNHSISRKDKTPRRASNRYSWSSVSIPSPVSTPSPTSPDSGATNPRKFKLPVRVSTELTSFASPNSSPESRRRSLSWVSENKRRSRTFSLQQLEEEDKVADTKKSPPKDSAANSPPPPAYSKPTASSDTKKPAPPPAAPPAKEQPPPAYEKPVSEPPKPEPKRETPAPRQAAPTTTTQKMSSASSPYVSRP